ncbi:unnamed protein product [Protopolystoma xenopodis]|uniref:Uncharacterized protein n=1 Tax=Protopolystoma xenopodis TaxID=117903 RepID=A0A448XPT9_9PLAT|nr:unnamed protein product [Protopolystoma xenopodis]
MSDRERGSILSCLHCYDFYRAYLDIVWCVPLSDMTPLHSNRHSHTPLHPCAGNVDQSLLYYDAVLLPSLIPVSRSVKSVCSAPCSPIYSTPATTVLLEALFALFTVWVTNSRRKPLSVMVIFLLHVPRLWYNIVELTSISSGSVE